MGEWERSRKREKAHFPVFGYQSLQGKERPRSDCEKKVRSGDSKEVSIRLQRVERASDVLAGGIAGNLSRI